VPEPDTREFSRGMQSGLGFCSVFPTDGGDVEGGLAAVIQVILHQAPGHPDGPQDGRKKSGFIVSPPAISFKSNLKVNHVHQG
jgi:hypothetical protein